MPYNGGKATGIAMAKLLCVFSTLAASVAYTDWKDSPNGVPIAGEVVTIKGGAGVANEHFVTPRGVPTMVTEAQAEVLKRNGLFQLHEKNGYVAIDMVERPPGESEVENAAAALNGRDTSAPLVDADFTANGDKAPTTGTAPAKGKGRK
jgi:hypothetical protein